MYTCSRQYISSNIYISANCYFRHSQLNTSSHFTQSSQRRQGTRQNTSPPCHIKTQSVSSSGPPEIFPALHRLTGFPNFRFSHRSITLTLTQPSKIYSALFWPVFSNFREKSTHYFLCHPVGNRAEKRTNNRAENSISTKWRKLQELV